MDFSAFGPVWDASGVRGFFGEPYWFHNLVPNLDFAGSMFVAKTTTFPPNRGNMEMTEDYQPRRLFPDCIYVDFIGGRALNSVGLSGPGLVAILASRKWQAMQDPFLLSFMSVAKEADDQVEETRWFTRSLKSHLPDFKTRKLGLQFNVTCPNVGADMGRVVEKAKRGIGILQGLGIPLMVKYNVLVPPRVAAEVSRNGVGICISNSIPFGERADAIDWEQLFPNGSPLAERGYGGGGLSGIDLLPLVERWVYEYRSYDSTTYINAGGGVMKAADADVLFTAGANSIFIGSVAMLRPWRVASIIRRGHELGANGHV